MQINACHTLIATMRQILCRQLRRLQSRRAMNERPKSERSDIQRNVREMRQNNERNTCVSLNFYDFSARFEAHVGASEFARCWRIGTTSPTTDEAKDQAQTTQADERAQQNADHCPKHRRRYQCRRRHWRWRRRWRRRCRQARETRIKLVDEFLIAIARVDARINTHSPVSHKIHAMIAKDFQSGVDRER